MLTRCVRPVTDGFSGGFSSGIHATFLSSNIQRPVSTDGIQPSLQMPIERSAILGAKLQEGVLDHIACPLQIAGDQHGIADQWPLQAMEQRFDIAAPILVL